MSSSSHKVGAFLRRHNVYKIIRIMTKSLNWHLSDIILMSLESQQVIQLGPPEGLNNVSRFLALIFLTRKVLLQENSFILVLLIDNKTVIVFMGLKISEGGRKGFLEKTIFLGAWVINQHPWFLVHLSVN